MADIMYRRRVYSFAIFLIILLNYFVKISANSVQQIDRKLNFIPSQASSYYKYNTTNSSNSNNNNDNNLFIKTIKDNHNSNTTTNRDYIDLEEFIAGNEVANKINDVPNYDVPFTEEDEHLKLRSRRHAYTVDLCKTDCSCSKDSTKKYLSADCTFLIKETPYVIGRVHLFPKDIRSLKIKLAKDIRVIFEAKSFMDATLNSMVIEGNSNDASREHVEIQEYAFIGNGGIYPEINITDCHTVILRKKSFANITRLNEFILNVENAENVNVYKEAFSNTKFRGRFSHIKDLRIPEGGFAGATESNIVIEHSNMDTFDRLETSLKGITVTNSNINTIKSEAFNVISVTAIVFQNCNIGTIESNVFTQKLYSQLLEFSNCKIQIIKTQAIDESGVNKIIFENNDIKKIEKNAISVSVVNMSLSFNSIKYLQHHWLKISNVWQNITIFNNTFGELDVFKIEGTANPLHCVFAKNSITIAKAGCLNETNYHCKIQETYFYSDCTCNLDWIMKLSRVNIRAESYCRIDDLLKKCFNASLYNVEKYRLEVCGDSTDVINCIANQNLIKTEEKFIEPQELETNDSKPSEEFSKKTLVYIGIGIASVLLFVILIVLIGMSIVLCYRGRRISIPLGTMGQCGTQQKSIYNEPLKFLANDRLIIRRTLELMREKQPIEKYNQVYDLTQQLLNDDLTESQKVATIGHIIDILDKCENSGEDFTAFTGILYNHLAPTRNNVPPRTIVHDDTTLMNDEPIYAEINQPHNNVQQPLLHNIYASPHDLNDMTDIYVEPILNELEKTVITPYAIGNQLSFDNKPSTSKNLPDVLSQSAAVIGKQHHFNHHVQPQPLPPLPKIIATTAAVASSAPPSSSQQPIMTNVKKIASNFANDPNFHIMRSPITNRKIPQYTIPNKSSVMAANVAATSSGEGGSNGGGGAVASSSSLNYNKKNKKFNTNNNDSDSSNSHSDYSGGSDITFKIDEIEYADAS